MFASPVPPLSSFSPSNTSSHRPFATPLSLSTTSLGAATSALSLHDSPVAGPSQPRAGTSEMVDSGPSKGAKNDGTKQPRKRGRKRIDEAAEGIKGSDSLDADAKRKLQNRAAQRAFRERKEKHVADLETRVVEQENELKQFREVIRSLQAENEALRRGEQPKPTVFSPSVYASLASEGSTASPPSILAPPDAYPADSPTDTKPVVASSLSPSGRTDRNASEPAAAAASSAPSAPGAPAQPLYALPPPPAPAPAPVLVDSTLPDPPIPDPAAPLPSLGDIDMSALDDLTFDFDAPFDFSDSIALPPLFSSLVDDLTSTFPSSSAAVSSSSTAAAPAPGFEDDACPLVGGDDDDPPPLPGGRIPCDKPECDFSQVSCALPVPWRPPTTGASDRDVWVAQKCWAKLLSHPLFAQCDSDELCQELRNKTRCSDDGRLVVSKEDVCDIFRQIPAKAKLRARVMSMQ
ncbi:hypothetical protein JCM10207_004465 [Rhodosporidiobolus poonsookiae]